MDRFLSLSVFTTAVDSGSFAGAARAHGMTPAMAGKHVAALEASLGVRLMQRTTRRLHLTDAGTDYYRRSLQILEALADADRSAALRQAEPSGLLRIAAPSSFAALQLGGAVAEYTRRYPKVALEMSLEDRFVDLLEEGYDLAIRVGSLPDSSLVARRIGETQMIACASPAYLALHGRPKTPAELDHHARLAFSRASSAGDWSFTGPDGLQVRVGGTPRLKADNMQMLLAAAVEGGGIVYGPSFVLSAAVANGALERILPDFATQSLAIHAVYPTARLLGLKVRRFLDLLKGRD